MQWTLIGLGSDVAEGGESCLTSGDRREPEENGPLSNLPLPPRSALPSEGEEAFLYIHHYPRVPFSHPRLSMIRRLRRRLTTNLLYLLYAIKY